MSRKGGTGGGGCMGTQWSEHGHVWAWLYWVGIVWVIGIGTGGAGGAIALPISLEGG